MPKCTYKGKQEIVYMAGNWDSIEKSFNKNIKDNSKQGNIKYGSGINAESKRNAKWKFDCKYLWQNSECS